MDDLSLGLALRAARVRRRLRQIDLAAQAGVSASLVTRLEHGDVDRVSLRVLRAVAAKLSVRRELVPRSAGGELDRVINASHAALGERAAAWIARRPGSRPEATIGGPNCGEPRLAGPICECVVDRRRLQHQ